MARARTEAQKRAERKYDQTKREVRGEIWALVAYPESLPEDWYDILTDLHIQVLVSPLHDKDVNADGEVKKPHFHIVLIFESLKSLTQVKELAEKLNCPAPMKQDSKRGIARYLCHLDNPEKAQYPIDEVMELGGADYRSIINTASDKYEVIGEIIDWLELNPSIHRWSFARLLHWSRQNNEKWFRGLCDNCSWVVKEYLQSRYWEMKETNGNVGMVIATAWEIWEMCLDVNDRFVPKKKIGSFDCEDPAYDALAEFRRQGITAHIVPPGFSPYDMR